MAQVFRNRLLSRMHPDDVARLSHNLERVELLPLERLEKARAPLKFVYFPEIGGVSLVSHIDAKRDVEVGIVGFEGMTGETIVMGDTINPYSLYVEIAGYAHKIPADAFRAALAESPRLQAFLMTYVRAQNAQVISTLCAYSRGTLAERLARWVLMCFDRLDSDKFKITHDALAWMLATRRPSVTDALHILEGKRVIRSNRGEIVLLDHAGLQEAAGGTYGFAESEYARLLQEDFRIGVAARHVDGEAQVRVFALPDKGDAV